MKSRCKHCGTPYTETDSSGPFCCSGCEHVYTLIQDGGLGEFYVQRNAVGRPMKGRVLVDSDFVFLQQLQSDAERPGHSDREIVLGVDGLTCFGCVWLVEHLANRREGVTFAKVALSSARIHLGWKSGKADLVALARELNDFGYSLKETNVTGISLSPLLLRFLLTLMFSINASIVLALSASDYSEGDLNLLFSLLALLSLFFSLFVGGQVFFHPAWRAIQIGRWHRDLVPAGMLSLILLWALIAGLFGGGVILPSLLYFGLLPLFLFIRWLSEAWTLRST